MPKKPPAPRRARIRALLRRAALPLSASVVASLVVLLATAGSAFGLALAVWIPVAVLVAALGRAAGVGDVPARRQVRQGLDMPTTDFDSEARPHARRVDAYARRERAAADLGRFALNEDNIAQLAMRAGEVVRESLGIDVVALYELLPDGRTLAARDVDGATPGSIARLDVAREPYLAESERPVHSELARMTLSEGRICTDTELGRSHADDVLPQALELRSFVSVALVSDQTALGVLLVGSRSSRIFGRDDTSFVRIVANVLAGAIARRRMERARRQTQQLAGIGRLASGVVHEVNTPIQFIEHSAAFLQTAARDLCLIYSEHAAFVDSLADRPELADRVRILSDLRATTNIDYILEAMPDSLDRIQLGVDRVAATMRALRPLGAIRSASAETDVNELLKSAAIITNHLTKKVADVKLDPGQVPPIAAHPGELLQVLQGLIINAVDAIEARSDGGRGTIVLRSMKQGPTVVLEVEDDGCGIPEAECPRIFEEHHTTKGPGEGMGQGLAIAQDIVERGHRGSISVWSDVGQGSTFRLEIPTDLEDPISWRSVAMTPVTERKCS